METFALSLISADTNRVTQADAPTSAIAPKTSTLLSSSRAVTMLLAVIVSAGMAIRAYRLTDRSIWFDEASSWRMSELPFDKMLESNAKDNHVPLYFVLLKFWIIAFGDSLWAMRGLSVLFGGGTIVGAYLFAAEVFGNEPQQNSSSRETGRWIGLVSAALVAVSLLQIRAAWEARMYTLGTALIAFSSWTLFRALYTARPSWKRWTIHGLVTVLFAYTHNYALFSIAGQVIFLAGYFFLRSRGNLIRIVQDRQFRAAALTYAVVAIEWGLWLPVVLRQAHQVQQRWWGGPLKWDALNRVYEMFFDGSPKQLTAMVAILTCLAMLVALVWKAGASQWYVLCLALVPCGMGVAVSLTLGRNIFIVRYLIFAQLFLLVGFAALLGRIRNLRRRDILAIILVVCGAAIHVVSWNMLDIPERPGMKGAIAFIEANEREGDQTVVCSPMLYFPATYYFRDRMRCHVYSDGTPFVHHRGGPIATHGDLILGDQLEALRPGRVWVIDGGWARVAMPIPVNWRIKQQEDFQEAFDHQGKVEVKLYDVAALEPKSQDIELSK